MRLVLLFLPISLFLPVLAAASTSYIMPPTTRRSQLIVPSVSQSAGMFPFHIYSTYESIFISSGGIASETSSKAPATNRAGARKRAASPPVVSRTSKKEKTYYSAAAEPSSSPSSRPKFPNPARTARDTFRTESGRRVALQDPHHRPSFTEAEARYAVALSAELFKTSAEILQPVPEPVAPSLSPVSTSEPRTVLLDGRHGERLAVVLDRGAVYGLRSVHDLPQLLNLQPDSSV